MTRTVVGESELPAQQDLPPQQCNGGPQNGLLRDRAGQDGEAHSHSDYSFSFLATFFLPSPRKQERNTRLFYFCQRIKFTILG